MRDIRVAQLRRLHLRRSTRVHQTPFHADAQAAEGAWLAAAVHPIRGVEILHVGQAEDEHSPGTMAAKAQYAEAHVRSTHYPALAQSSHCETKDVTAWAWRIPEHTADPGAMWHTWRAEAVVAKGRQLELLRLRSSSRTVSAASLQVPSTFTGRCLRECLQCTPDGSMLAGGTDTGELFVADLQALARIPARRRATPYAYMPMLVWDISGNGAGEKRGREAGAGAARREVTSVLAPHESHAASTVATSCVVAGTRCGHLVLIDPRQRRVAAGALAHAGTSYKLPDNEAVLGLHHAAAPHTTRLRTAKTTRHADSTMVHQSLVEIDWRMPITPRVPDLVVQYESTHLDPVHASHGLRAACSEQFVCLATPDRVEGKYVSLVSADPAAATSAASAGSRAFRACSPTERAPTGPQVASTGFALTADSVCMVGLHASGALSLSMPTAMLGAEDDQEEPAAD